MFLFTCTYIYTLKINNSGSKRYDHNNFEKSIRTELCTYTSSNFNKRVFYSFT